MKHNSIGWKIKHLASQRKEIKSNIILQHCFGEWITEIFERRDMIWHYKKNFEQNELYEKAGALHMPATVEIRYAHSVKKICIRPIRYMKKRFSA